MRPLDDSPNPIVIKLSSIHPDAKTYGFFLGIFTNIYRHLALKMPPRKGWQEISSNVGTMIKHHQNHHKWVV